MRVLLLLSESWNDKLYPNNNMTNWFSGFENLEIWTISGSSQIPQNQCCKDYFLIGENEMIRSLAKGERAGKRFTLNASTIDARPIEIELSRRKNLKKYLSGETARLVRDIVWRYGKYDLNELDKFIKDCNPDIVFSQRRGSVKMCRLESIVSSMTSAPMIAYSGDDEYSLHQFSLSPVYWFRRFWARAWLKKVVPTYALLYSQSERQMREYEQQLHVRTKFLVKCGDFLPEKIHKSVNEPIRIVYAGKLYCNRWKTLKMIANQIRCINGQEKSHVFQLNIYTADPISEKQNAVLNDGYHSVICGAVSPRELLDIYKNTDIVLHVESFDLKNRLLTQDSFSTKVMDCLSSGCAVMAVCWEKHAAYQYLKEKDAAITASSQTEIFDRLRGVTQDKEIILQYAHKAFACGSQHHQRQVIQNMLMEDFERIAGK